MKNLMRRAIEMKSKCDNERPDPKFRTRLDNASLGFKILLLIGFFTISPLSWSQQYVKSPILGVELPTKGGVEDFGVSRPSSCDPKFSYTDEIFKRYSYISGADYNARFVKNIGPKVMEEVIKDRPNALKNARQNESDAKRQWYNEILRSAESYTKLVAGSRSPEQILQGIRRGDPEFPRDCSEANMKKMGASANIACAVSAQLMEVLAYTELFHLQVCGLEGRAMVFAAQPLPNAGNASSNSISQNSNSPSSQSSQAGIPTGPMENCNALFTPERLKSLPGPQYVQEFSDCLKRNVARGKAQTAVQVEAPPLQAAQQQAQQSRAAQQQSQQAVFNSAQNQTAADQTRKSERRRHEPENEAHDCLSLDKSGLFGGIVNKCDFKVAYQFCNFNPKKDSWAESHTCGKSGGADFVGAGRTSAAHVKNTETVYWFACKDPAWPLDVEYVAGKGIQARCYTIGGK